MSDLSQGPGWWQASDGKWYPPEQHPSYVPPSAPPPAPGAFTPPPGPAPSYSQPATAPPYGQAAPPYAMPPGAAPPYGQPPAGAPYGYAPGPVDSQGRPLAEWWQRLVAIFIDGLIIGAVYLVLASILVTASIRSGSFTHFGFRRWLVDLIVGLGEIAYFAFLEGSARGQSVGQMALGIAVRDADTGGAITPKRAGIRMVILYPWLVLIWIPLIGPFLAFIGDLWSLVCGLSPLWNPKRQGYHDIAQKTTVIKVR